MLRGGHLALGVTIGCCVTLFAFLTLELFSTVLSPNDGLWAALVGAMVGGGIGLAGQVLASNALHERELEKQRIGRLSNLYSISGTFADILSETRAIQRHIVDSYNAANKSDLPNLSWGVMPLSSVPKMLRLENAWKVSLIEMGENDLFNSMQGQDKYASNLVDHYFSLQERRAEVFAMFDIPNRTENNLFPIIEGKEEEVGIRSAVMDDEFRVLTKELNEIDAVIVDCINQVTSIIQKTGNSSYSYEVPSNGIGFLEQMKVGEPKNPT